MNSTKYDELELTTLKYNELRDLCKEEGLKAYGKKVDMIASLKNIPPINSSSDSSSSSSTMLIEDSESSSDSALAARPVFGDISVIMVNSPLVDGLGGQAKKRRLGSKALGSNKENDTALLPTSKKRMNEEHIQTLTDDMRNREGEMENLIKQFEEPARKVAELIQQKKMELDEVRTSGENHYRKLLEERLQEKERELKEEHNNEIKSLRSYTEMAERILRNKLLEAVQEKKKLTEEKSSLQLSFNTKLLEKEEELKSCTESLQQFTEKMAGKDREIAASNTAVTNSQKTNEALKTVIASLRDSLKQRETEKGTLQTLFNDMTKKLASKDTEIKRQTELIQTFEQTGNGNSSMNSIEDELTCIICQELFISASTLPCAHSFCEMCLRTWFKSKKTCPVCRADVKLKVVFSVVIDNIVECCIENSSDDVKRKRTILLRERNEQKRTADAAADPQSIKAMFYKAGDVISAGPTLAASANRSAAGSSAAGSSGGGAARGGGGGNNANRRRSRSQSPTRGMINRGMQAINYNINRVNNNNINNNQQYQQHRIRCFNCGNNHHIRDCPYNHQRYYQR